MYSNIFANIFYHPLSGQWSFLSCFLSNFIVTNNRKRISVFVFFVLVVVVALTDKFLRIEYYPFENTKKKLNENISDHLSRQLSFYTD